MKYLVIIFIVIAVLFAGLVIFFIGMAWLFKQGLRNKFPYDFEQEDIWLWMDGLMKKHEFEKRAVQGAGSDQITIEYVKNDISVVAVAEYPFFTKRKFAVSVKSDQKETKFLIMDTMDEVKMERFFENISSPKEE